MTLDSLINLIKIPAITVGFQVILVIVAFSFFYWKEGLNKRNLLHRKKEVNEGMIFDKEIEIESAWILLRQAEARMEKAKEVLEGYEKEIKEEKEKTPGDWEKIKKLRIKSEKLGYTGKFKDDKPLYNPKGMICKIENEVEAHHSKITEAVMQREYLKVQLRAIKQLIKKGYAKSFEKFEEIKLREKVLENLKKK